MLAPPGHKTGAASLRFYFGHNLDFDGRIPGKAGDGDGGSRMFAGFSKDRDKEVAGSVDHRGAVGKAADSVHKAVDEDNARHAVERPKRQLDIGEGDKRADTGGVGGGLNGLFASGLAGVRDLSVHDRERAGAVEEVSGADGRKVVAGGGRRVREFEAEFKEFLFRIHDASHHVSPCGARKPRHAPDCVVFLVKELLGVAGMMRLPLYGNMPTLTADAAFASALTISDWQGLAARDPELAARELLQRLKTSLSEEQRRSCFASMGTPDALAAAFQRAGALPREEAPLAGVPYTLKDLYQVAGQPVRAGSRFPFDLVPVREQSGRLPQMLEGAGAVLAARTHLYEFAYGLTGENETHGDCEHPHFPGRTSGGSSSGAAASVAAGIVPFAAGTDTGGSVRVPAAFCGLFGMRLTPGDEWIADAFPLSPGFDTAGWFTQNAPDMETVNRAILGPGNAARAGRELRGCFADFAAMGLPMKATREFSRALRETGRKLAPPPDQITREEIARAFHGAMQSYVILQSAEAYNVHQQWLDKHRKYYSKDVWARLDCGRRWAGGQLDAAQVKQRAVRVFWEGFFKSYDFLVMPATPFTALTKAECTLANRERLLALMAPASLGGLPVLTVPVRLPSGLSAGLQVIVRDQHSPVISKVLKRMA